MKKLPQKKLADMPGRLTLRGVEVVRRVTTGSTAEGSVVKRPSAIVESVIDRAVEVLGDRNEAMRWLGTPIRALDYATPISLLGTRKGASRVEDVLGRMEHGVW